MLTGGRFDSTLQPLLILWLASTVIFVLFGAYVVRRLVLAPLQRLSPKPICWRPAARRCKPAIESRELAHLSKRYRAMAESLIDAQAQMVRVEKLAGIGSLAAGVAHEVRNPLGALGTYVDVLRRRGADPEVTDAMRGAIQRIERTVQSLLTYAKPGAGQGATDLNNAVRSSLNFLGAQGLLKNQRVTVELESGLPAVRGDGHLLEQVVVNLVINACHASPGGTLVIGTTRQAFEPRLPGCNPGRRLLGSGIECGASRTRPALGGSAAAARCGRGDAGDVAVRRR
jgi:signal transduction histidine kinase